PPSARSWAASSTRSFVRGRYRPPGEIDRSNASPRLLPTIAVDDILDGPAVRTVQRSEWTAGGEAERDEDRALPILGHAEDAAGEVLIPDRGVSAPDPEVGRGEHDRHRHLPDVVLERVALVPVLGGRHHEDDRRRGRSDVGRVPPCPRQLTEPIVIRDDDEIPGLLVHRGGRSARRLEDPSEVVVGDRPVLVPPNVPASPERVPGLHAKTIVGSVLGEQPVDLLACVRQDIGGVLSLGLRTRSRELHGRGRELAPGLAELPEPLAERPELPGLAGPALPALLELGPARVGDRVDALAVPLLARDEPLVLEQLQRRVDRSRARPPRPAAPLLEFADQVVAVHRVVRQQREQRGSDVASSRASASAPRRAGEPGFLP